MDSFIRLIVWFIALGIFLTIVAGAFAIGMALTPLILAAILVGWAIKRWECWRRR